MLPPVFCMHTQTVVYENNYNYNNLDSISLENRNAQRYNNIV